MDKTQTCSRHYERYTRSEGCAKCMQECQKAEEDAVANGEGHCVDCGLCTEGGLTRCPGCEGEIEFVRITE